MFLSTICSLYLGEYILQHFFKKSLTAHLIQPYSEIKHDTPEFSQVYKFNKQGLRGEDINYEKSYDITLIGDSFLFGIGVSLDSSLHGLLDKVPLEVANFGESGTMPVNYLYKIKVMQALGIKSKSYVVGIFFANDFAGFSGKGIKPVLDFKLDEKGLDYDWSSFFSLECFRYVLSGVYHKKIAKNVFVHKFENVENQKVDTFAVVNRPYPIMTEKEFFELSDMSFESVEKVATLVNEMYKEIPSDSDFYLMMIPDRHYVNGELSVNYLNMKQHFSSLLNPGIYQVDLHDFMTMDMYFLRDGHWNESGHYRAFEILKEHIEK